MPFVESISSIYSYQTNRKSWKCATGFPVSILSYQLSGHYDHKFSSDVLKVKKDTLFFIPAGSSYSVRCIESGKSVCISFFGELNLPPTVCDCSANPEIKNLFLKALRYRNLHPDRNVCEASAIVYSLLAFLFQCTQTEYVAHNTRSKIESACTYLTEHYTDPSLQINDLAERIGLSPKYFCSVFQKLYHSTPAQYRIALRLQTAANLLAESNLSISQIAELSGFSDVYYFSKLFKSHFSVSPKEYRKLQHNEEPTG